MTIFCIISVARQVDGEYILIKSEKAFSDPKKADAFLQKRKDEINKDGKQLNVVYSTPHGDVNCMCEIGVFEVELEE